MYFCQQNNRIMDIDIREIEIRDLRPNCGEVEGLPRNPRKISKKNLEKLKKSVQDAPEMLRLRELIVVPHGDGYVVIAGNQRLEAAKAVGMERLPCKVLPEDTDPAKLREYAIKDNLPFGEDDWEVIASDWETAELEEWGMSVKDSKNPYTQNTQTPIYEITGDCPSLDNCMNTEKVNELIKEIENADISSEQKMVFKCRAYMFADIDFRNFAEYYAHQSKEVQQIMEKLALVIVDFGAAIENGFVKMDKKIREIYESEL